MLSVDYGLRALAIPFLVILAIMTYLILGIVGQTRTEAMLLHLQVVDLSALHKPPVELVLRWADTVEITDSLRDPHIIIVAGVSYVFVFHADHTFRSYNCQQAGDRMHPSMSKNIELLARQQSITTNET